MATLYGREWHKDELRRRCGRMEQIAGVTRYVLQEGTERGVEICDVRTGSGFRFCVAPSRGLDITFAEHNGRPLCWNSATGVTHPAYFDEHNFGWLRGFYGGLLVTCGLLNFSDPCEDAGEQYGLHDRASYLPATHVYTSQNWSDDGQNFEIVCGGKVRETRVFGPHLVLERRITTQLGANHLTVRDRIINEGFTPAPAVLLYHCNFGFPVVAEDSAIHAPSAQCEPRDEAAQRHVKVWNTFETPQPGGNESCYFHTMQPGDDGFVNAAIWNAKLSFGAYVRYRFDTLKYFTQWKMMGAGEYVCGLEPSNAPLMPRTQLRECNALPMLEPGQTQEFEVELGVLETAP